MHCEDVRHGGVLSAVQGLAVILGTAVIVFSLLFLMGCTGTPGTESSKEEAASMDSELMSESSEEEYRGEAMSLSEADGEDLCIKSGDIYYSASNVVIRDDDWLAYDGEESQFRICPLINIPEEVMDGDEDIKNPDSLEDVAEERSVLHASEGETLVSFANIEAVFWAYPIQEKGYCNVGLYSLPGDDETEVNGIPVDLHYSDDDTEDDQIDKINSALDGLDIRYTGETYTSEEIDTFSWGYYSDAEWIEEDVKINVPYAAIDYGYGYGLSSSEIAQQEPAYKHEPVKLVGKRTKHDGQAIDISDLDAGEYLIKSEIPGDLGRYSYLLVD